MSVTELGIAPILAGLVEDHAYRHGAPGCPLLMFSAGGNAEAQKGRPSAGRNQTMLKHLLVHLHRDAPAVFASVEADDYPMLNAWPEIESHTRTKRSEASLAEVRSPTNVVRIIRYVAGRPVIAFGERARCACEAARIRWIGTARHLSLSGLNRIKTPGLAGPDATMARVGLVRESCSRPCARSWPVDQRSP